jgi:hypothetical protein
LCRIPIDYHTKQEYIDERSFLLYWSTEVLTIIEVIQHAIETGVCNLRPDMEAEDLADLLEAEVEIRFSAPIVVFSRSTRAVGVLKPGQEYRVYRVIKGMHCWYLEGSDSKGKWQVPPHFFKFEEYQAA